MAELTERIELINEGGVEVEIIQGDFPGFYLALIFESSDDLPDYITEWDRVTNDPKRGSWSAHAGAFTLRSRPTLGSARLKHSSTPWLRLRQRLRRSSPVPSSRPKPARASPASPSNHSNERLTSRV
jgi:hypothetical protein